MEESNVYKKTTLCCCELVHQINTIATNCGGSWLFMRTIPTSLNLGKISLCRSTQPNPNLRDSFPTHITYPSQGWLPLSPPEKDLIHLPLPGRTIIRNKEGFQETWVGLPSGQVQWTNSTVLMPAVFWSASGRKWKRDGQTGTCNLRTPLLRQVTVAHHKGNVALGRSPQHEKDAHRSYKNT